MCDDKSYVSRWSEVVMLPLSNNTKSIEKKLCVCDESASSDVV